MIIKFLKNLKNRFDLNIRRRQIDLDILWPELKKLTDDLQSAKNAFRFHVDKDHAWIPLTSLEKDKIIEDLK